MVANDSFSMKHDWTSQAYVDEWIKRDVQKEDERRPQLREMLAQVSALPTDAPLVLDVGGGFGVVTGEVLNRLPRAQVTLQDYSQPMLGHARERLACFGDQVRYVLSDLRDPSWANELGGPFDLIVSSWAIHNLGEAKLIETCYRNVENLLRPGSAFLNYDLVDYAGGVTTHLDLLRNAGFSQVACVWHQTPGAIIKAVKSVPQ